MPRGDRTGPWGRGPRTGRGLGFCSGYDRPGYFWPGPGRGRGRGWGRGGGRGWGRGRGFGRGFGRGYGRGPPPDVVDPYYDDPVTYRRRPYYDDTDDYSGPRPEPEDEKEYLRSYLEDLEAEIADVKKRLEGMSKKK